MQTDCCPFSVLQAFTSCVSPAVSIVPHTNYKASSFSSQNLCIKRAQTCFRLSSPVRAKGSWNRPCATAPSILKSLEVADFALAISWFLSFFAFADVLAPFLRSSSRFFFCAATLHIYAWIHVADRLPLRFRTLATGLSRDLEGVLPYTRVATR